MAAATGAEPARTSDTQVAEEHPLEVEVERAGLSPAQLEQVVDQSGEMIDFLAQRPQVPIDRGRIVDNAVLQCLDDRAHPRQRGTQIVRHPRHELPARSFERPLMLPSLGQTIACRRELGREIRELDRGIALERPGRVGVVVVADPAGRGDEGAARAADARAENEPPGDRNRSCRDQDHGERGQVVLRDEHRSGRGVRAREHGDDRAARERADLRTASNGRAGPAGQWRRSTKPTTVTPPAIAASSTRVVKRHGSHR